MIFRCFNFIEHIFREELAMNMRVIEIIKELEVLRDQPVYGSPQDQMFQQFEIRSKTRKLAKEYTELTGKWLSGDPEYLGYI